MIKRSDGIGLTGPALVVRGAEPVQCNLQTINLGTQHHLDDLIGDDGAVGDDLRVVGRVVVLAQVEERGGYRTASSEVIPILNNL